MDTVEVLSPRCAEDLKLGVAALGAALSEAARPDASSRITAAIGLLEQGLAAELRGKVESAFRPEGLNCCMESPPGALEPA